MGDRIQLVMTDWNCNYYYKREINLLVQYSKENLHPLCRNVVIFLLGFLVP